MIRRRLVWFTLGFSVTAGSIAQFIYKDLWTDRCALKSDVKQKFDALETRVSNLESIPPENPNPAQHNPLVKAGSNVGPWFCHETILTARHAAIFWVAWRTYSQL